MMIHFSLSSLMMSVIFSNILLILLYGIFKNTKFLMGIGYQLLTVFLAATLLRFLFPFELFCSTTIHLSEGISQVVIFFKEYVLTVKTLQFTLWHVFLVLWVVGSVIGINVLFHKSRRFSMSIRVLGTDLTHREPYASILQRVCAEQNQTNDFRMMTMPGISSPMITGLRHPVILLPDTLTFTSEELYYILSHEAAHHFRHDLWIKFFSQLLCILYWWNPFIYALRRQITTILELRIDHHVTVSADPEEKYRYMECLFHVASEKKEKSASTLGISFGTSSRKLLLQRFQMIGNNAKQSRRKQIVLSTVIIILYAFSVFFIFEPVYTTPEVAEDSFMLPADTSYLIVNPEGGYDLYLEGQYAITIDAMDEALSKLKVYQSQEELP